MGHAVPKGKRKAEQRIAIPMTQGDARVRAKESLRAAVAALRELGDESLRQVFDDNILDQFLASFAPPAATVPDSPYEYLRQHKTGLTLLALLRHAITQNYSKAGVLENESHVFVSPNFHQWFADGVMFLQGQERFGGAIGLYENGKVKFAIAARDTLKGVNLDPNDFLFVDVADLLEREKARPTRALTAPETAQHELRKLLDSRTEGESHYQRFLSSFPWAFGDQYSSVEAHQSFNDENIPDFTGVRVRDGARDILEIKDPFLGLFRKKDEFSAEFNNAWNQTERYLDFARREADYLLRQKGLRFENPHCFLIAGYQLTAPQKAKLRAKERMNPAITVLAYDDLLAIVDHTVALIRKFQAVPPVASEDVSPDRGDA